MNSAQFARLEWPTIITIAACYLVWFSLAFFGAGLGAPTWIVLVGAVTTLYWSLVHEVVHGHPTTNAKVNSALVWLPIGWVYPIGRFRDSHLQHHATGELTDPFDDPESWYMAKAGWEVSSRLAQRVLVFNNTLFGRMLIGPLLAVWRMVSADFAAVRGGRSNGRRVILHWVSHVASIALLVVLLRGRTPIPAWWFAAAAYLSVSLLLIRTFLEHQASADAGERTVIIEDRGPLAFLFLFNNLHIVHHTRPGLAWYHLPAFYRRHRAQFLRRNNGYVYDSYWRVFRRYFFRPKEPVLHPFAR